MAEQCAWSVDGVFSCAGEEFANLADLGQNCDNATCIRGTCFEVTDDKSECRRVLWPNQRGCTTTQYTSCIKGTKCANDTCVHDAQDSAITPHVYQSIQAMLDSVINAAARDAIDTHATSEVDREAIRQRALQHARDLMVTYNIPAEQQDAMIAEVKKQLAVRLAILSPSNPPVQSPATPVIAPLSSPPIYAPVPAPDVPAPVPATAQASPAPATKQRMLIVLYVIAIISGLSTLAAFAFLLMRHFKVI